MDDNIELALLLVKIEAGGIFHQQGLWAMYLLALNTFTPWSNRSGMGRSRIVGNLYKDIKHVQINR